MAPRAAHVGITLRGPGSARTGGTTRAAFVPAGESTYRLTGANGLPCNFPVPGHSCTPTPGRYVVRARFKVGRTTIVTPPVSVLVRSSAGRDIASS
jgi:hypothetical protein